MLVPLSILFGALLTVVTALAIGRTILRRARVDLYRGEEDALGFVVGSAILSLVVFALSAMGVARRGVFLAIAAAAILIAVRAGAYRNVRPPFKPLPRFWRNLFFAGFTVFTVLYFFSAMAPEFSPDGISYHLSFVARYAREHGFVRIPWNLYAQLSQGIELLYLMAFLFGKHSAAALVHYSFLLALVLAVVSYGRRIGYPIAGLAAGLLVYASPVVGIDGTSAYIDVAVACILFAVFYFVQLWDEHRLTALLMIIGLLAGFAYAAKYTAILALPYAAVYVLWKSRKIAPAALVVACSVVLIAPWVIKDVDVGRKSGSADVQPLVSQSVGPHLVRARMDTSTRPLRLAEPPRDSHGSGGARRKALRIPRARFSVDPAWPVRTAPSRRTANSRGRSSVHTSVLREYWDSFPHPCAAVLCLVTGTGAE